jgi:hypothetical protein
MKTMRGMRIMMKSRILKIISQRKIQKFIIKNLRKFKKRVIRKNKNNLIINKNRQKLFKKEEEKRKLISKILKKVHLKYLITRKMH